MSLLYWDIKLSGQLARARTWQELCQVAVVVLEKIPRPTVLVCGPLATDDLPTREENRHVLNLATSRLRMTGLNVFDRTPFEDKSFEVTQYWKRQNRLGLDNRREVEFDGPLLNSKWFSAAYFLTGWENDLQARRERDQLEQQGVVLYKFPSHIYKEILAKVQARSSKVSSGR